MFLLKMRNNYDMFIYLLRYEACQGGDSDIEGSHKKKSFLMAVPLGP